jgi:hypothetical protein
MRINGELCERRLPSEEGTIEIEGLRDDQEYNIEFLAFRKDHQNAAFTFAENQVRHGHYLM